MQKRKRISSSASEEKNADHEASIQLDEIDFNNFQEILQRIVFDSSTTSASTAETTSCTIDSPIDGKPATTICSIVRYFQCKHGSNSWFTLVDLFPQSGRTHQLRKHTLYLGHPIVGDRLYRIKKTSTPTETETLTLLDEGMEQQLGLCLFAVGLNFPHPVDDGEKVSVELSQGFRGALSL
ncbi:unnamed protein product [Amoebophrya sp. A25]|nr:unnamed protein product [Amoebophrya sp. A25]|eukprot:GSA25T00014918001.1